MKRSIWGLLILVMAFVLVSCTVTDDEPEATTTVPAATTSEAEETTAEPEETTEEATEEAEETTTEETSEETEETTEESEETDETDEADGDDPALVAPTDEDDSDETEEVTDESEEVTDETEEVTDETEEVTEETEEETEGSEEVTEETEEETEETEEETEESEEVTDETEEVTEETEEVTEETEEEAEETTEETTSEVTTTEESTTEEPITEGTSAEDIVIEFVTVSYITVGEDESELADIDAAVVEDAGLEFVESSLDTENLEDVELENVIDKDAEVILLDAKSEENLDAIVEVLVEQDLPLVIATQRTDFTEDELAAIESVENTVLISYETELEDEAAEEFANELVALLAAMSVSDNREDWFAGSAFDVSEDMPFYVNLVSEDTTDETEEDVTEEDADETEEDVTEEVTDETETDITEEDEEVGLVEDEDLPTEEGDDAALVAPVDDDDETEVTTTEEVTSEETTSEESATEETISEESDEAEPVEELVNVAILDTIDPTSLPDQYIEEVKVKGLNFVHGYLDPEAVEDTDLGDVIAEDIQVVFLDTRTTEDLEDIVDYLAEAELPLLVTANRSEFTDKEAEAFEKHGKAVLLPYSPTSELSQDQHMAMMDDVYTMMIAMNESEDLEAWIADTDFVFSEEYPFVLTYLVSEETEADVTEEDVDDESTATTRTEESEETLVNEDEEETLESDEAALVAPVDGDDDAEEAETEEATTVETDTEETATDETTTEETTTEETTEETDEVEPTEDLVKVAALNIKMEQAVPEDIKEELRIRGLDFVDAHLDPENVDDADLATVIAEDTQVIFYDTRTTEDLEGVVEFLAEADLPLVVSANREGFTDEELKAFEDHGKAVLLPYTRIDALDEDGFDVMLSDFFAMITAMSESDDLNAWIADTNFVFDEDIPFLLSYAMSQDTDVTEEEVDATEEETVDEEAADEDAPEEELDDETEPTPTIEEAEGDDPALVAPVDEDIDEEVTEEEVTEEATEEVTEEVTEDATEEVNEEDVDTDETEEDVEPVDPAEELPIVALLALSDDSTFSDPGQDTEPKLKVEPTTLDPNELEDVELGDLIHEEAQGILIDLEDEDLIDVVNLLAEVDVPVVLTTQRTEFTDDEIAAMEDVEGLLVVVYGSDLEDDEVRAFVMNVHEVLAASIENGTDEVESWLVESNSAFILDEEHAFIAYAADDLVDVETDETDEDDMTDETAEDDVTDETVADPEEETEETEENS